MPAWPPINAARFIIFRRPSPSFPFSNSLSNPVPLSAISIFNLSASYLKITSIFFALECFRMFCNASWMMRKIISFFCCCITFFFSSTFNWTLDVPELLSLMRFELRWTLQRWMVSVFILSACWDSWQYPSRSLHSFADIIFYIVSAFPDSSHCPLVIIVDLHFGKAEYYCPTLSCISWLMLLNVCSCISSWDWRSCWLKFDFKQLLFVWWISFFCLFNWLLFIIMKKAR